MKVYVEVILFDRHAYGIQKIIPYSTVRLRYESFKKLSRSRNKKVFRESRPLCYLIFTLDSKISQMQWTEVFRCGEGSGQFPCLMNSGQLVPCLYCFGSVRQCRITLKHPILFGIQSLSM